MHEQKIFIPAEIEIGESIRIPEHVAIN